MRPSRGFTLVELMATLAVLSVLVLVSVPSFGPMLARAQLREAAEGWMSHAYLARIESMRTGQMVHFSVRAGRCYGFRVGEPCDCAEAAPENQCTFARGEVDASRVQLVHSTVPDGQGLIEPVSGLVQNPGVLVWRAGQGFELRTGLTRLGRPFACTPADARQVPGYSTAGCEHEPEDDDE